MDVVLVVAFAAAALVTLLVAVGSFGRYAARQRRDALRELAARNHLTPRDLGRVPNPLLSRDDQPPTAAAANGQADLPLFSPRLTLFTLGERGYADNILEGSGELDATFVFDYVFFDGRSRTRGRRAQTVVQLRAPDQEVPPFTIKPRQDRSKLGASRHFQHAEDAAGEEFRSRYALYTETEAAAASLAGSPALAALASRPGLCVEAAGPDLIVFLSGQELTVEALPALVERAREIRKGLSPRPGGPGSS